MQSPLVQVVPAPTGAALAVTCSPHPPVPLRTVLAVLSGHAVGGRDARPGPQAS